MARLIHYDGDQQIPNRLGDPFGDDVRDEPFSIPRDDTMTFTTTTSGVPMPDPSKSMHGYERTESESLAINYRQNSRSPSLPAVPSRLPSPSGFGNRESASASTIVGYRDEDPYATERPKSFIDKSETSLVDNAAGMGRSDNYQDFDYAEPMGEESHTVNEKAAPFQSFLGSGKYPMEQRIEDKKRGIGRQKHPFVVWALTIAMAGVFINELVVNSKAQGTPVSFKPVVNPMLGPSESALINLGARFPPCMKAVAGIPSQIACLNDTANPPDRLCSLEDVCGFGGFHGETPNQWYRFITAIFLHAGFIHILLNMVAQLTVSAQIEREMGSAGFLITYFAAGIFGNVLGGNFSLVGAPSIGASGAIFGTVAVTWVDLFAHWKYQYRPGRKLAFMSVELIFGIALGYIPYVDNFAHLGGLCMGLLVGTTLYPVISPTKRHKLIMWGFRLAAIPLAIILFVVLIRNFYTSDPYAACSGCRYLSCIPTSSNNHCQGTGFTTTTTTGGSSI
ncbi:rhomboid-domain-containing protein [Leucogyrophana mollusca]|uniref:Rhomboid-domain-containing protein n=1 Tax=Leucogyrophana mollusca TaxID=85980 RepID=A0ACB8BT23_9AGAM|nr:rhomboid-domain-containing protein [Leucogyrophana mollusca]